MLLERAVKVVMERKGYYISPELRIVVKKDKAAFDLVTMHKQNIKHRKGNNDSVGYVTVSLAAAADGKAYYIIKEIGCRMDIKLAEFCELIDSIGQVIVLDDGHKGLIEVMAA